MNDAEYRRIADQLGAGPVETAHELANANWDLQHRPETTHGHDAHEIAADVLTATRAQPQRPPLAEVHFTHHHWTPSVSAGTPFEPTPADEFVQWYEQAVGVRLP